jgi:hypothetical protein
MNPRFFYMAENRNAWLFPPENAGDGEPDRPDPWIWTVLLPLSLFVLAVIAVCALAVG